jgi:hypothetical protein
MSFFTLPRDNNSQVIQALHPSSSVNGSISSAGAVRLTLPANTEIVRAASTMNCYLKFGDSAVVATSSDLLFPVGAEVFSIKNQGFTHVSILGIEATPGAACISRMT